MNEDIKGVIGDENSEGAKDYLFRISIKSLIRNADGHVLMVKETGRTWWDLPGGGMNHDETIKDAIARELKEEVGLSGNFTYRVIAAEDPALLMRRKIWQVRMVCEVAPENMDFAPGDDGDEVAFIAPEELKKSGEPAELLAYQYAMSVSR